MINVYIQKWSKEDAPWERILADVLKTYYYIEETPTILRDEMGKPYLKDSKLHFNVSHSGEYLAIAVSEILVGIDIQETKNIKQLVGFITIFGNLNEILEIKTSTSKEPSKSLIYSS